MKSGIAVAMKLMEHWKRARVRPETTILFTATCDEEVDSRGILRAIDLFTVLKGHRPRNGGDAALARFIGGGKRVTLDRMVNVDYTTEMYPGDSGYHIWNGTIGKVLAGVFVRGVETHAGEYFRGFHAIPLLSRLISAIDGSAAISGRASPPAVLKAADSKSEYNVMTSPSGYAYFNIFTTRKTPAEIMRLLRSRAEHVVRGYLGTVRASYASYRKAAGLPAGTREWSVDVCTYSQLLARAERRAGRKKVAKILGRVGKTKTIRDARERTFGMIEALIEVLGSGRPTVVLCFLPPFYPYIKPRRSILDSGSRAMLKRMASKKGIRITVEENYPYISDMSYLRIEPEIHASLKGLIAEMPSWGVDYNLDFGQMRKVNLPVLNVGPYGFGAHQAEERVSRRMTFEILPELIDGIVRRL